MFFIVKKMRCFSHTLEARDVRAPYAPINVMPAGGGAGHGVGI